MKYILTAMMVLSSVLAAGEIAYVNGRIIADCAFDEFHVEILGTNWETWGTSSPYRMDAAEGTFDIKCTIFLDGGLQGYEVIEDVYLPAETSTTVNFNIVTE